MYDQQGHDMFRQMEQELREQDEAIRALQENEITPAQRRVIEAARAWAEGYRNPRRDGGREPKELAEAVEALEREEAVG